MPAIQAARRSQCINKLKQIGIALQNYHGAYGTFPKGWLLERNPGDKRATMVTDSKLSAWISNTKSTFELALPVVDQ